MHAIFWFIVWFVSTIVAIYQFLKKRNEIFKILNLPYVPGNLLFGNLLEIFGKPYAVVLNDWTKQFGSVYGYMEGGKPTLVVSDPNILQELFVKKFNIFHARKFFPLQPDLDKGQDVSVFIARGRRWKRLRSIANPTFSAANLKQMIPTFNDSIDKMLLSMEKRIDSEAEFDIYPYYQRLTLDVIARTAFGYEQSLQEDEDNDLISLCKLFFGKQTLKGNFFTLLALLLPELNPFWRNCCRLLNLLKIREMPFPMLEDKLKVIVEERRNKKQSYSKSRLDFIQLLLEAEAEPESLHGESHTLELKSILYNKRLTSVEVVSQSVLFLIAGYETTSTSLGFTTYLLATHPEVQDKLREEINQCWDRATPLDYDTVMKMKYLDQVVREGLRLYPIGSAIQSRTCMESVQIGDLFIPEGMIVSADVMQVHYSEELWGPDAHIFRPERFDDNEKRSVHPMAWIPFGAGPRACIGLRFALLEEKLALTKAIAKFNYIPTSNTKVLRRFLASMVLIYNSSL